MRIRSRHNADGIAIIIAVIAVLVFSALAAGFALSMKVESRLAFNANSETQLYWLGRSGVELARWVLAQERCPYDSLNQIWAGGPGADCETNGPLAGLSLNNYPIGDGTVSITIIDLERKVNINTASAQEIQQALTLMGVDANDISVVSDSIQDWIQPGDLPRVAGAKSDYYQGLDPPYYAKEAPIDDLSELLLVRGVTPEMYWGGSSTNHALATFQHKLGLGTAPGQTPNYQFGLVDVFTPVSLGQVNVNTADANVLQIILGGDAATAENIIEQRASPDGVDGTPFLTPPGTGASTPLQQATTRSSTFEVYVTAQIGIQSRECVAILFRPNPGADIKVMSFYWK
jgi:general secretion pathway protein K